MNQYRSEASTWPTSVAPADVPLQHNASARHDFVYGSARHQVRAKGVFSRLQVPVESAGCQEAFHRQVKNELARARACGVENPLVVGAIPFDRKQPTELYIPLHSRISVVSDQSLLAVANKAGVHNADAVAGHACIRSIRSIPEKVRFCQGVQQALANFGLSDIRKAVLARILDVELQEPVAAELLFRRLQAQNPSSHHFLVPLADGSSFLGASPELLVYKQGEELISNPLAGSAPRQIDRVADQRISQALLGSGKDSYEHRLVVEEIERLLHPLCQELWVPEQPSLMSTAAMWHLSTLIQGQLRQPSVTALELATLLHPTPAVCGVPTSQAYKLINLIEPFQRDLFAGTVGWCDEQGNGEWVVSIRCGQVFADRIRLFAGCGIVADSDPEAEWHETQAKLQTMLRVLLPEEVQ